jgi:DNA-binding MarR family transcriptional regulator/N-acetylglutamate synthase-like GNAT family acetyltransferase
MIADVLDHRIAAVRRFNRFYTQRIGALRDGLLGSAFSLTEARVLYELAQHDDLTAAALCRDLALDAGYVSRILRGFDRRGLIVRTPAPDDKRQSLITLTKAGRAAFAPLDQASKSEIGALLGPLSPAEQGGLVDAMQRITGLLGAEAEPRTAYLLRPHGPGDLGWITHRHGALYRKEFGWNEHFEALVADIAARFLENFDAARERCWIVERDGEPIGSAALARDSDDVARLRLLLVEPKARGFGLGARLVEECVRFARHAEYTTVRLSTYSILAAARRLYHTTGFRLVAEHPEHRFGHDLIGEDWELRL